MIFLSPHQMRSSALKIKNLSNNEKEQREMIMMQKEVWSQSVDEVLRRFKTTRSGLSGETAKERLQTTGENVLEEGKKKTAGQIFLSQFCDLLVVILLIAGGISMISGNLESTCLFWWQMRFSEQFSRSRQNSRLKALKISPPRTAE